MLDPHLPTERFSLALQLAVDTEAETSSTRSIVLEDAFDFGLTTSKAGLCTFGFVLIVIVRFFG